MNVDFRPKPNTWLGINLISTDSNKTYDALQLAATMNRRNDYARLTYTLQRSLSSSSAEGQEVGSTTAPLPGQPIRATSGAIWLPWFHASRCAAQTSFLRARHS